MCVCVGVCGWVCVPCFCWLSGCQVWNDTVANLSLLALGTSAPEILLSVIEIVGNQFVAGELGPGTIVGSAAFNLLVISAICIVAIPSSETRRIASVKVFAVTAASGQTVSLHVERGGWGWGLRKGRGRKTWMNASSVAFQHLAPPAGRVS